MGDKEFEREKREQDKQPPSRQDDRRDYRESVDKPFKPNDDVTDTLKPPKKDKD